MHGLGCVLGPDVNAKPIADCAKALRGHWPVRIRQDSASVFDGSSAKTEVVGGRDQAWQASARVLLHFLKLASGADL